MACDGRENHEERASEGYFMLSKRLNGVYSDLESWNYNKLVKILVGLKHCERSYDVRCLYNIISL